MNGRDLILIFEMLNFVAITAALIVMSIKVFRQQQPPTISQSAPTLHDSDLLDGPDASVAIDERGKILQVNGAAVKLFGYHRDEMIGQNVIMLMPAAVAEHHDEYLKTYLLTGEKRIINLPREVFGKKKNDKVVPILLTVSEAWSADGLTRHFIGTCRDISYDKWLEMQGAKK